MSQKSKKYRSAQGPTRVHFAAAAVVCLVLYFLFVTDGHPHLAQTTTTAQVQQPAALTPAAPAQAVQPAPAASTASRAVTTTAADPLFGACAPFLPKHFPEAKDIVVGDNDDAAKVLQGNTGGDWSPCTHMRKYGFNFPTFLARSLAFHLRPRTALELGCGLGTMADFLARFTPRGAKVVCLEPSTMLAEIFDRRPWPAGPAQLAVNVFEPEAAQCKAHLSSTGFDLVYSFEVAEHIPLDQHAAVADFLVSATRKFLVFSAAHPGQGGHGHIGLRSREDWARMFRERGLVELPELTVILSNAARRQRSFDIFVNLVVFRHKDFEFEDKNWQEENIWFAGQKNTNPSNFNDGAHNFYQEGLMSALWPELEQFMRLDKRPCKAVPGP
jgi:SAM-dependent methyltransferase